MKTLDCYAILQCNGKPLCDICEINTYAEPGHIQLIVKLPHNIEAIHKQLASTKSSRYSIRLVNMTWFFSGFVIEYRPQYSTAEITIMVSGKIRTRQRKIHA